MKRDFKNQRALRIFVSYFGPHKKLFIIDMLCAICIAAVDLIYPLVSRNAMYELLPNKAYTAFFTVMCIIIAAYALRSLFQFIITYWGHTFGIRVEADIRRELFAHMQTLGFDFFDKNRTGQLMSRLSNDLFELTELAHHGPEDVIISTATIIGSLIVMYIMQWRLAIVVTVLIPLTILVVTLCRKKMMAASGEVKAKTGVINTEIESSLSGMRTAKAFANEEIEFNKFSEANERFKYSKRSFHKQMGIFASLMEFFTSIMSVAVIAVGGWLIMKDKMNYIDLLTFSLYVTAFVSPVRKLVNFSEQFTVGFAGLKRFMELMRTDPSITDAEDAVTLENSKGEIVADNISFSYTSELPVLNNVSLHIAPGETIAIVGPSGGGKTTLCQLIPRFYDVSGGSISVDGTDIRRITQSSLRKNIGIVQQDVFLFAATVIENIRYGKPDATMEEIIEATKKAEIYDDIMAMPNGFDTYVGERGVLLSGGQKQRISIARIFLKNPPILILDEATSALDTITEAKIQSAFDALAKGRTTLIIAHRLSTIRSASRILVISDGVIKEQGSHEELMAVDGIYANLYNTQTKLH